MQKILLIFLLFLLSSCSVTLSGRVNTATYVKMPTGASFVVVGADNLTLTERSIQTNITNHMLEKGFKMADEATSADIAAVYSYKVGAGVTEVSSSRPPCLGMKYEDCSIRIQSSTTYPRYFQITLVDLKASKLPDKVVIIWQGEIYSNGSGSVINFLARDFINELFDHFGETVENKTFIRVLSK